MMDKKNWLWALAGMGLLLPGMAQALGLGDLRVLSAPGEPFRAEISIQSLSPQSEASIRAGLAPASAFAMIDLPKAGALDHWHFTVRSGDRPAILISSPLPLPQPALHFLVQLNWSGGQLVREYAAYNAGDSSVPTPQSVVPVPPSSTLSAFPATSQPVRHAAPAPIYHGWSRVSRYGPVPANGSLFQVAQYITRSSAVTLDQVMAALVKANPQAFKGGNPAYLYAGSMLTVPSLAQVQAVSPAQAKVWLSAQRTGNGMSAVATTPTAATVIPSGAVTAPAASAVAAVKSAGNATHLVLSSAPAAVATAVAASTASTATTGQLRGPDAVLRDDNQKLMAEVASLGQRLSAEERLLASQGAQLATLSRTAGNSSLFNNIPLVVSLGGNILLLVLFLWMLRRQKEAERRQREISQRLSTLSAVPRRSDTQPQPQPPEPVVATAAPITPAPSGVQSAAVAVPVLDALPGLAPSADHPESAKDAYTGAEIDPIEQADLYLTYGKAVQAVTVLNESLEENPRRKELYVKLLDIYANLDRYEEYLDLAERMRGRFGPHNAAWQEVAAQGARLFPGNALFATSEEAATATTSKPVTEVSFSEPVEKSVAPAPLDMLDFHFDHAAAEPTAAEEKSAFPPEEKARLLQDIDEQFRLMEETREESPAALEAPVAAPLVGLAQHDEPSTPALPASSSAAAESPASEEASISMDVADWDAVGTKLDLAKAYVEMGDSESARDLLEEVTREGSSVQQEEARQLLKNC
ncbi:FimV/HubP family polar landmark protein [Acidithiobacillus sp.]|jgi:pilus assembly protein FimV|uniref:FimV/HubP family polar landmark protein n=1 Tax=Acidithiobacillus sp. TaxID=1872118 RepID=UPI0025BDCC42|nr:FimV/HubP family polar landmark protein [Acidithiobacillus sp.]MCK9189347.1 Motility protein FimV [Acidithiobacillus sp.]MCK9359061.1 Motility protein FimV [Acidithiobacillus sp.]